jgi:hypothetical protein
MAAARQNAHSTAAQTRHIQSNVARIDSAQNELASRGDLLERDVVLVFPVIGDRRA